MLPTRLAMAGAIALMLGMVTLGAGLMPSLKAEAGNGQCDPFGSTPDPQATVAPLPTCTPQPTQPLRSATPTEAPEEPTDTAQPQPSATTAPPTQPPATATSAGGAGAGVQAPDTGTGAEDDSRSTWLIAVGAIVALAGTVALLGGMRRRNV